jgi:hypothetical protein
MHNAAQACKGTAVNARTDPRRTRRHAKACRVPQTFTDLVNSIHRLGEHHSPPFGLPAVDRDSPATSAKRGAGWKSASAKRWTRWPSPRSHTVVSAVIGAIGNPSVVSVALRVPIAVTGNPVAIGSYQDRPVRNDRPRYAIAGIAMRSTMIRMPHARWVRL